MNQTRDDQIALEQPDRLGRAGKRVLRWADSPGGVLLLCLLFSLVLLYHLVIPLSSVPSTNGVVWNDPAHSIWSLWLVNEAVTHGHSPYATNMVFYPVGARLIHPTVVEGFFPITFLTKLLSGGNTMYAVYTYHIIILLCAALILDFSYQLLRKLGITRCASATAAIGYAFSDFFIEHAPHVTLLAAFFIPLTALLFVRLYEEPAPGRALVLALTASLAVYFTEFALYIFMALLFVPFATLLFSPYRKTALSKLRSLGLRPILYAVAICLLVLAPFVINHLSTSIIKPLSTEQSNFSANLAGFIIPHPERTILYGRLFSSLANRISVGIGSFETFVGFPFLVFAVVGLIRGDKRFVHIAAIASLAFFALSLGPTLKVFRTDTGIPMPYSILARIPPFDIGRTPVRFVSMGIFFLMMVAASGMASLQSMLRTRWGRAPSWTVMALFFVWTVAEAYSPSAPQQPFVPPAGLKTIGNGPVLNLPVSRFDGYAALLQVFHKQPIATGYISRYSSKQVVYVEQLERLADKGEKEFCNPVTEMGFRNIIINPVSAVQYPFDLSRCPINVVDLRKKVEDYPFYTVGSRIDFSRPEADQYLGYGWSTRELLSRWTDRGRAVVAFSLDRIETSILRIKLAPFLVPKELNEQHVSIELNGQFLQKFAFAEAGWKEYSIVLPPALLRQQNILIFELPDAESPRNLRVGEDVRLLGINVQWMEITPGGQ